MIIVIGKVFLTELHVLYVFWNYSNIKQNNSDEISLVSFLNNNE